MNSFSNINTAQQRPVHQTAPTASNGSAAAQQFSGAVAPHPQFNANILQLLLTLILQLIQLISDQKPDEPEQPQDQTLNPDEATRDKLANILGVPANTLKVTDRDGNGQLSAGDLVEGTIKNEAGQDEAVSSELSALALKDINGELGSALTLDPPGTSPSTLSKERLALNNVVGVQSGATDLPQGSMIETVFDSDNSGRISAGDVVAIRTTGAEPLSLNYVELSADDVKQFENQAYGPELTFSEAELNQLEGTVHANAGRPVHGSLPSLERVFDTNRDGRLSAGDLMEFKDNGPTLSPPAPGVELPEVKPIFNYAEITQDDIKEFESQAYGPELALSQDDLRRLTGLEYPGAFGGTPPFIQRAFDTDGDGQVSAGDTIETAITRPGTVLEVDIEYSEITQEVADRFNAGNEAFSEVQMTGKVF